MRQYFQQNDGFRPGLVILAALSMLLPAWAGAIDSIVVHGLFRDMAIISVDGAQYTLKKGKSTAEGVRLVSANSKEATLEVDGQISTYTVGTHIAGQFKAAKAGSAVQIAPDRMGMYFISGSINGFGTRFLVDTGATYIAMNRNEARRMGIDYRMQGIEGSTSTASGVAKAYYVSLDRVRVGGIEVRDVSAAVIDGDYPTEILLGNSFLSRLDMSRSGALMELRQR